MSAGAKFEHLKQINYPMKPFRGSDGLSHNSNSMVEEKLNQIRAKRNGWNNSTSHTLSSSHSPLVPYPEYLSQLWSMNCVQNSLAAAPPGVASIPVLCCLLASDASHWPANSRCLPTTRFATLPTCQGASLSVSCSTADV